MAVATIGVPRESAQHERRVALVPAAAAALIQHGLAVLVEHGAGDRAGYDDAAYVEAGAVIAESAAAMYHPVITERDSYMAAQLERQLGDASQREVLVVIGAALLAAACGDDGESSSAIMISSTCQSDVSRFCASCRLKAAWAPPRSPVPVTPRRMIHSCSSASSALGRCSGSGHGGQTWR